MRELAPELLSGGVWAAPSEHLNLRLRPAIFRHSSRPSTYVATAIRDRPVMGHARPEPQALRRGEAVRLSRLFVLPSPSFCGEGFLFGGGERAGGSGQRGKQRPTAIAPAAEGRFAFPSSLSPLPASLCPQCWNRNSLQLRIAQPMSSSAWRRSDERAMWAFEAATSSVAGRRERAVR